MKKSFELAIKCKTEGKQCLQTKIPNRNRNHNLTLDRIIQLDKTYSDLTMQSVQKKYCVKNLKPYSSFITDQEINQQLSTIYPQQPNKITKYSQKNKTLKHRTTMSELFESKLTTIRTNFAENQHSKKNKKIHFISTKIHDEEILTQKNYFQDIKSDRAQAKFIWRKLNEEVVKMCPYQQFKKSMNIIEKIKSINQKNQVVHAYETFQPLGYNTADPKNLNKKVDKSNVYIHCRSLNKPIKPIKLKKNKQVKKILASERKIYRQFVQHPRQVTPNHSSMCTLEDQPCNSPFFKKYLIKYKNRRQIIKSQMIDEKRVKNLFDKSKVKKIQSNQQKQDKQVTQFK